MNDKSLEFLLGGRGDISLLRRYGGCNPFRGGGVKVDLDDGGSNLAGDLGIGGIGTLCLISTFEGWLRECCNAGGGGGKPGVCEPPGGCGRLDCILNKNDLLKFQTLS